MLLTMRRLTCLTIGLLATTAAAQQAAPPASIGIVLDASGSMGAKIVRARQVAAQFLNSANSQDEFFLVEAANHPLLDSAFTIDPYRMLDRLAFAQPKGRSALWDSVSFALAEMTKAQNPRKALVLISDGGDNSSRSTPGQVAGLAHDAGVPIYIFGIHEPAGSRARTAEESDGPEKLNEMADQSGGRYFAVENINDVPIFTARAMNQIRSGIPAIPAR